MEPIDLEDISFNKSDWIGKGRLYPKDHKGIPRGLTCYCNGERTIPNIITEKYIPGPLVTVKAFVEAQRPKIQYGLASIKLRDCFRMLEPDDIESLDLDTIAIPSKPWVTQLDGHFNQAILDNMKSVVNPEYPGVRLPLWIINFWKRMHEISGIQQGCKESLGWIEDNIQKEESEAVVEQLKEARTLVHRLRWNETTDIPGGDTWTTTFIFSTYLSNQCMNDTHINMMFSYLAERAQDDEDIDTHVDIEGLRFMRAIDKVSKNQASMKFLQQLEKKVEKAEVLVIEFPVYLEKEKHWVAGRVDFENAEISFGM